MKKGLSRRVLSWAVMRRILVLLLLLTPVSAASAAEGDGYDKILERYERLMESASLDRRVTAFRLLDPGNDRSLPVLKEALKAGHWFVRGHAAEVLKRVTDEALRAELRLDLLTHEEDLVREGIALAFALSPEKGDAEALSEALGDPWWRVRRMAAIALADIVSRESLASLVDRIRKEEDPRVAVHLADTLKKITGRDLGRDGERWRKWWEKNRDREEFEGLEEEKKRRELGGIPLETVTVPTRKTPGGPEEERDRLDIFVLPPFGFRHDIYRPYLDELARFGRVTYVKLPRVSELTGSSGYGPAVPAYPVGGLVKALEELREELGKRRVVVIGEGATGWIAERYAIRYRSRTAALVVLNGYIDAASYAGALLRLSRSPTPAERWAANTLMNRNEQPHDEPTYHRITRILLTADLMDPTDARGWLVWRNARDPQGFAVVQDFRFPERAEFEVPTAFFFGGQSRASGLPDAERIRKHFPKNVIAPMHKSRGFCFVSEYEEFYRVLEGFFEYYDLN